MHDQLNIFSCLIVQFKLQSCNILSPFYNLILFVIQIILNLPASTILFPFFDNGFPLKFVSIMCFFSFIILIQPKFLFVCTELPLIIFEFFTFFFTVSLFIFFLKLSLIFSKPDYFFFLASIFQLLKSNINAPRINLRRELDEISSALFYKLSLDN